MQGTAPAPSLPNPLSPMETVGPGRGLGVPGPSRKKSRVSVQEGLTFHPHTVGRAGVPTLGSPHLFSNQAQRTLLGTVHGWGAPGGTEGVVAPLREVCTQEIGVQYLWEEKSEAGRLPGGGNIYSGP